MARRLFRKAVQQGRSERRGDTYSVPYVEPLSDARTPLADFVNSLLGKTVIVRVLNYSAFYRLNEHNRRDTPTPCSRNL